MRKTCADPYVEMARNGINVLDINIAGEKTSIVFEYSWRDPKQEGKLHWSKNFFVTDVVDMAAMTEILKKVEQARKELERGE